MARLLTIRSQGEDVRELTQILVDRGYLTVTTTVFDSRVRAAVEEFQARHVDSRGHPLQVDGKVGELTWWALRHADNTDILSTPVDTKFFTVQPGGSLPGRTALEVAIQEMSYEAREIGANNSGPWVEKYLNGITPTPANWCAGFVSWCFSQVPGGIPFNYHLGARNIRNQFQRKGWTYAPQTQSPEPGDIIVWWRGQPDSWKGHIGIVHHHSNGILYSIEGNKGGFPAPVRVFDYVLGRIDRLLGFGRVPL